MSSLVSNKTSYVEEWATKHAFPVSRNMSLKTLLQCSDTKTRVGF